ncbi:TPA: hypothetical protein RMN37_001625 [Escherichia coli]|nr:hypothetical protein [Escherichia coli]
MNKTVLLLIALVPQVASAAVFGGSNLGYGGYPEFTQMEPTPPYSNDQYAWENYRREVERYTSDVKEYLEDANNDMKRIQEAQQEAIDKANNVVEEYNRNSR